jgi:formate dehydrogenase iron-sulfur subunit
MHHEAVPGRLLTVWNVLLGLLMMAGAAAFAARFALGLGGSTNLSDTYPWGLWIVFDLVWIALAAGAYVTAAVVYLFGGERYHGIARSAVLMGFLSYNFVVVTLLADLGLPWHAWQIAIQRPEHSAMFEVSWCVSLYVTVLALELAPVIFDRFHWEKLRDRWRRLTPLYVVVALTFFVFLMSHSVVWAFAALVVFSALTKVLPVAEGGVPILMIIAAVVFSTMHQSSLGSLFLLMPDKLSPLWWSPIMPLNFFLSSIVGGLATVIVMWILVNAALRRRQQADLCAGLGRVLGWALVAYLIVRLADVAARGHLQAGLGNGLFLAEIALGGILPAILLLATPLRRRVWGMLLLGLLAAGGIVLDRLNVVLLGMTVNGPMPGLAPSPYVPTLIESVLCLSLIAAAVFFFFLGVRLFPIMPRLDTEESNAAPLQAPHASQRRSHAPLQVETVVPAGKSAQ